MQANSSMHIYILQSLVQKQGRGIETVSTLMQKLNKFTHNQCDEQSALLFFLLSECVFILLTPESFTGLSSRSENEID